MDAAPPPRDLPAKSPLWRRALPVAALLVLALAAWAAGILDLISLEGLRRNRAALTQAVAAAPVASALAYLALYAIIVTLSLPLGLPMTLTGGFLFGPWLGTALAVAGATMGAVLVFLLVRRLAGEGLRARAGPFLARFADRLRRDTFSLTLSLRLLPVMPFWLTNLVPALAGAPLRPFALATLIGIIPATAAFASAASGLGHLLDRPEGVRARDLVGPQILLPLTLLAALSLLPMLRRRRTANPTP